MKCEPSISGHLNEETAMPVFPTFISVPQIFFLSGRSMPSTSFSLKATLAAFIWTWLQVVRGQVTDAICGQEFSWMKNGKGQCPCIVAAYLQGTCFNGGEWFVAKLKPGQMYLPPTGEQANGCQCNTVTYNMLSACAVCQNRGFASWPAWTSYCPAGVIRNGSYPFIIPNATAVPAWGFVDSSQSGNFNMDLALTLSGGRDSSTPSPPDQTSSRTQTGVIVGISIAGLACILCVGLALFYYRRSRRRRQTTSTAGDSIRFSALFNSGSEPSPTYKQLGVEGPPASPMFQWIRKVSSRPAEPNFTIDRDSTVGSPLSPVSEGRPSGIRSLFSHAHSKPNLTKLAVQSNTHTQVADPGLARDFTFVSSVGAPPIPNLAVRRNRRSSDPFNDPALRSTQPNRSRALSPMVIPSTNLPSTYDPPPDEDSYSSISADRETLYPWDSVSNFDGARDAPDFGYRGDERLSVISERSPSPPPQRSRLQPVPLGSPEMLYPLGVRSSVHLKPSGGS